MTAKRTAETVRFCMRSEASWTGSGMAYAFPLLAARVPQGQKNG